MQSITLSRSKFQLFLKLCFLFCANWIIETFQPTLIKFKVVQYEALVLSLLLHNRLNTQPYNCLKLFQHSKPNLPCQNKKVSPYQGAKYIIAPDIRKYVSWQKLSSTRPRSSSRPSGRNNARRNFFLYHLEVVLNSALSDKLIIT